MEKEFSELFDKSAKLFEDSARTLDKKLGEALKGASTIFEDFFDDVNSKTSDKKSTSDVNKLFEYIANKEANNCSIPIVYMFITKNSEIAIYLLAPYHKREDFKISVEKDLIVITGTDLPEEIKESESYSELGYLNTNTEFRRTLKLPRQITPDKIRSTYKEGLLKIYMPLPKKEETINIEIL